MLGPVSVLLVDDSAVIRNVVTRGLRDDPRIRVVGSAANGKEAIALTGALSPDVVLLDVEMPVMNGLEALPEILAKRPKVSVIMASALTQRHAALSFKALQLGAADYVPKPDAKEGEAGLSAFFEELKFKIKAHAGSRPAAIPAPVIGRSLPRLKKKPSAVAIGSSTGGPTALLQIFTRAKGAIRTPVFVTQHMPATFTGLFAEQLGKVSDAPAREGTEGETVKPGTIYVAPGGKHMLVERSGHDAIIRISDGPPEHFCKPAVDPMFRSLARVYGASMVAGIFTGMGQDGAAGCVAVANAGGAFIAQDEATSVVYGMPGAAFRTGRALAQLSLSDAAEFLTDCMRGDGP